MGGGTGPLPGIGRIGNGGNHAMEHKSADIILSLKQAGLSPPRTVTLAITNRCNLHCRHCWPESGPEEQASVVPRRDAQRLMADFAALGARKLVITGGEPLTHPHWFELLEFACRQPGVDEVRLQTNGCLLTQENVAKLSPLIEAGLTVQTSLEGATARSHDQVRGQGSFAQTLQGLHVLANNGLTHCIAIAFTEMRHNFGEIPQLLGLVDDLGIPEFVTGTLVCGGRAALDAHLAPPTPQQYEGLLDRFRNDKTFRERYRRIGNIAALEWSGNASCADGCCSLIESPYVTAGGLLFPCVMLHADEYAAADAYQNSLKVSIDGHITAWSELQRISGARSVRMNACQDCHAYASCRAGCMGRAFSAYGDFYAVEDRCRLRRAIHGRQSAGQ